MATTHDLLLDEFDYVGDSSPMYIARCSCGQYDSGKTASKLDAEKRWLNHMMAKTQNEK
jgi:hypothetical protein